MKRKPKARTKVKVPKNAVERFEKASYDKLCTDNNTGRHLAAALRWVKKAGTPLAPRRKKSKRK